MTAIHRYYFDGEINEPVARTVIEDLRAIHVEDPEADIEFTINSQGGSLWDGFAIYGELYGMSIAGGGTHRVTTLTRGYAASTATVLLQAGDRRVQGELDIQIWHQPSLSADDEYISDLERRIQTVKHHEKLFTDIVMRRAKAPRSTIEALAGPRDRYIFANEALELGLIDEIA